MSRVSCYLIIGAAAAVLLWPGSPAAKAVISVTGGIRSTLRDQPGGNQQ